MDTDLYSRILCLYTGHMGGCIHKSNLHLIVLHKMATKKQKKDLRTACDSVHAWAIQHNKQLIVRGLC